MCTQEKQPLTHIKVLAEFENHKFVNVCASKAEIFSLRITINHLWGQRSVKSPCDLWMDVCTGYKFHNDDDLQLSLTKICKISLFIVFITIIIQ